LARPKRFELPTPRFVVWCSIQLSYGRVFRRTPCDFRGLAPGICAFGGPRAQGGLRRPAVAALTARGKGSADWPLLARAERAGLVNRRLGPAPFFEPAAG